MYKRNSYLLLSFLLSFTFLLSNAAFAQVELPPISPRAKLTQKVGLTDVTFDYSRPSVQGRKIFGDLVSYGKVWRTGANESTKITFADNVTLEGNRVPAGTYALYTIPGADQWTIIIHKDISLWGSDNYNQANDLLRFNVPAQKNANDVEAFTIDLTNYTQNSADVELLWAKTAVKFRIETEVDAKVMAEIEERIKNQKEPDYSLYYLAAGYLYNNDKNLTQALEWINKSISIDPKYWTVHLKSKILAKQKKYDQAIAAANESVFLAKKARNEDYVKLNQRYIAQWKKLTKQKAV
ncbi:DUF2911 domain-containing protein [Adhaeribacter sp. BT258]|uniref:DUF2911 domain-containing protein n=1 Tax=Adhaeribacter terrigena TaxID=2793070 RepID=A0ABS1BYP9_9BACT|nr:DUF2911 domain-containing protein [Adhaeribacter terrigena]MBK0402037.1 DUF2911 domain-containing protein [Adhaeribacter terrigena]